MCTYTHHQYSRVLKQRVPVHKCTCVQKHSGPSVPAYLKRGYTNRRTCTRVLTHIHQYSGVLEICVPVHKCTYVPIHSCPSVPTYLNAGYTNGRTPNSCEKRKRWREVLVRQSKAREMFLSHIHTPRDLVGFQLYIYNGSSWLYIYINSLIPLWLFEITSSL